MIMIWSQPAASASSTPYWMMGLSTRGSISLGCALVAGRKRVPRPAAGNTALRTLDVIASAYKQNWRGFAAAAEARVCRAACDGAVWARIYNGRRGRMLDQTFVRENLEAVREGLRRRGMNPDQALDAIAQLLSDRRRVIPEFEELKRQQNASGEEIARAKRQGLDTTAIQEAGRVRAQQIKTLQAQVDEIESRLQ